MTPARFIGRHRAVEPLLSQVPTSWEIRRFKALLERSNARNEDLSAPMMSLKSTGDVVLRSSLGQNQEPDDASLPRYLVTDVNELVVNPMWLVGGAIGVSTARGAVSPDYRVFTPCADMAPRYLHYVVRSQPYIDQYLLYTRAQTTFDRRVQQPDLDNLPLPLPPLDEQKAIVDFLDQETERIDSLIEGQERLIDMLQERRSAVVSREFCGYERSNRIQRACLDIVDCSHTTPEVSENGGYEAVRTASVRGGKFRPGNGITVSRETWLARNAAGAPKLGDVLFTREAPAGEACMVPSEDICLGQRMVLLRVDPEVCSGKFLLWQIYSDRVQDHFRLAANGSTVGNVRLPVLRSTPIWLPPLAEQRRIVAHLDEQTAKIDTLIVETKRFIELSRERRSALITSAVTGQKINVRAKVA